MGSVGRGSRRIRGPRTDACVSVMSAGSVSHALEGMTEEADRCRTIAEAGAIPPLVGLLSSVRGREAENAVIARRFGLGVAAEPLPGPLASRCCAPGPCLPLARTWTQTTSITSEGTILVFQTRSESFDAWRIHVERCDDRLLLLSWRRGVVDERRA